MKKLAIILVLISLKLILFSQNEPSKKFIRTKNNFHVSLFSEGSYFSGNYERMFLVSPNLFVTSRIGLGYAENFTQRIFGTHKVDKYLANIYHLTLNIGIKKHFLEAGMGGTLFLRSSNQKAFFYPMVGYRFQPIWPGGVVFRVYGALPIAHEPDSFLMRLFSDSHRENVLFIPFGISIGTNF